MYSTFAKNIVTPCPNWKLSTGKDSFNFWLSNSRIEVECAFGMLVGRWGILWRRLDTHLSTAQHIIRAVLALHNFCIDERCPLVGDMRDRHDHDRDLRGNSSPVFTDMVNGHAGMPYRPRRDAAARRQHDRRDHLAAAIADAGLERPALPEQ